MKTGFLWLTIKYDLASLGLGMKSFSPETSSWIQDFMGKAMVWCSYMRQTLIFVSQSVFRIIVQLRLQGNSTGAGYVHSLYGI